MQDQEQKTFQRYLIISCILHLIFISVFMYGLPSFRKPPEPEMVVFDVVDASDIPNIRNQTPNPSKEPEIKESQRVKKAEEAPEVKEEPVKEEPAKEEVKLPEKEAEVIPEKKEEIKKTEKKKEEAKKEKPKEKPKPKIKVTEPPKKPVKKPAKKEEDVIDDILKNLEKESDGQEVKSPNRDSAIRAPEGKFAKGNNYDEDSPLSVTEKMLIKKQIEKQWQPPVGALSIENIQVILHLKVLEDGTITDVKIKDVLCPAGAEQTCDLVAQSSARAAKKASPLQNLRPNRYDIWREFDLRFDPSNIMK